MEETVKRNETDVTYIMSGTHNNPESFVRYNYPSLNKRKLSLKEPK